MLPLDDIRAEYAQTVLDDATRDLMLAELLSRLADSTEESLLKSRRLTWCRSGNSLTRRPC